MTRADIDRIAVAHLLLELAESFTLEATLWPHAGCKADLERGAAQLATLGRLTLRDTDIDKAEAFAQAGTLVLRNIQGARRFLRSMFTPPHVPQPRKANDDHA